MTSPSRLFRAWVEGPPPPVLPGLTEGRPTGNFFLVLRRHLLIASFVFFFSLWASVGAFAVCLFENEVPARPTRHISSSNPCFDNGPLALRQISPRDKNIQFLKMHKKAVTGRGLPSPQLSSFDSAPLQSSGAFQVPLANSIYQLKAVYRI